ncbi:MAG: hypothetical protein JWL76_784 [Thermoleophilia bacterium]|nr:hypothetical protein [Thermoleophilia bacterium]
MTVTNSRPSSERLSRSSSCEQLEVADDRGERRAQLVAHECEELLLHALGLALRSDVVQAHHRTKHRIAVDDDRCGGRLEVAARPVGATDGERVAGDVFTPERAQQRDVFAGELSVLSIEDLELRAQPLILRHVRALVDAEHVAQGIVEQPWRTARIDGDDAVLHVVEHRAKECAVAVELALHLDAIGDVANDQHAGRAIVRTCRNPRTGRDEMRALAGCRRPLELARRALHGEQQLLLEASCARPEQLLGCLSDERVPEESVVRPRALSVHREVAQVAIEGDDHRPWETIEHQLRRASCARRLVDEAIDRHPAHESRGDPDRAAAQLLRGRVRVSIEQPWGQAEERGDADDACQDVASASVQGEEHERSEHERSIAGCRAALGVAPQRDDRQIREGEPRVQARLLETADAPLDHPHEEERESPRDRDERFGGMSRRGRDRQVEDRQERDRDHRACMPEPSGERAIDVRFVDGVLDDGSFGSRHQPPIPSRAAHSSSIAVSSSAGTNGLCM